MKGKVLRSLADVCEGEKIAFLSAWQNDAVLAIDQCAIGGRDSYPGQGLYNLITGGFIDANEVEDVCIEWLSQNRFKEKHGRYILNEILSLSSSWTPRFLKLSSYVCARFSELLSFVKDDWSRHQLVIASSFADTMDAEKWSVLNRLFQEKYFGDICLFENLYFMGGGLDPMLREQCLQLIAKKARRIKRALGDNSNILRPLEFMLYRHFGLTLYSSEFEYHKFMKVEERVRNWIEAQNAHVPFPIK